MDVALDTGLRTVYHVIVGLASQVLNPSSSVYWVYLAAALFVASAVYLVRGAGKHRRTVVGLLRFLFPRAVYGHRSARHDLGVFVVNALLYSFVLLTPLAAASLGASRAMWAWLVAWFGTPEAAWDGSWARAVATVAILLTADFGFYLSHLVQHKIAVLWEFHKVHHSAPVLWPMTVFRRHPVDVVLERGLTGVLVGAVLGIFGYLSGGELSPFTILGVNAGLFLLMAANFNLQHSHVWLSYGRTLNRVLISPALHQIHHSTDPRHFDKNMGNLFSLWDLVFGTLYVPETQERITFGLGDGEEREYGSLLRLYLVPFKKAAWTLIHSVGGRGTGN